MLWGQNKQNTKSPGFGEEKTKKEREIEMASDY